MSKFIDTRCPECGKKTTKEVADNWERIKCPRGHVVEEFGGS